MVPVSLCSPRAPQVELPVVRPVLRPLGGHHAVHGVARRGPDHDAGEARRVRAAIDQAQVKDVAVDGKVVAGGELRRRVGLEVAPFEVVSARPIENAGGAARPVIMAAVATRSGPANLQFDRRVRAGEFEVAVVRLNLENILLASEIF